MISTSLCYVSFFVLIEHFIRSRRSLFFQLMLTFSYCLHRIIRDQTFQTDRIPRTDITVLLYELWASWPSMNVVHLRSDKSGSADLLTSATILSSSINSYRMFRCAGRSSHISPSGVAICRPLLSRLLRRHRSLRRLHRRLTVLSHCSGSRYARRVTPGYRRRRTSPHPLQ